MLRVVDCQTNPLAIKFRFDGGTVIGTEWHLKIKVRHIKTH